jgi:lantibiotic transport system permease protein
MSLLISLRSELLKSKRTASVYLTLLAAAVVPFIFVLDATVDGISPENRSTIFSKMFIEGFRMSGFVILPIFIILVCTLLPQVEYKNNTWKQVFTSPQTKGNVFVAKLINIHFLILLFIIANQFFLLMAATLLHFTEPTFNVLNQPIEGYEIFVNIVNAYVSLLAMCTLQFWLGLRFRNFIIPIAIGISLWVIGSMLVMEYKFGWAVYFPYSFHVYNTFPNHKPLLNTVEWASGAYAAAFLLLGFLDFKTNRSGS